ncbi:MAG: C39 family peptidase [Chloroflexota bacterium]
MTTINIPYRSQWDNDAKHNNSDCGPTCVAMILNHHNINMTPDTVYDFLPPKEPTDFTFVSELIDVFKRHRVAAKWQQYTDQADALNQLRRNIGAGNPMIALVKYRPWMEATQNQYEWGHFVVVTGYSATHVTMHDPLFGMWALRSQGAHYAMSNALFAAGWGGFPSGENPNWSCIVVGETSAAPTPRPAPQPAPQPVPQPSPPPPPPSGDVMEDETRRIEALAAYRWTEPPRVGDETAVQLWRDHLGDFGLTYDKYTVRPGDTLVRIAANFYGEQHRWPAIKAYNDLQRESLWVGQKLLVPRLGQSNAHKNSALPSDTLLVAKELAFDDLVDPDMIAQDYNALGSKSIGIGFGS